MAEVDGIPDIGTGGSSSSSSRLPLPLLASEASESPAKQTPPQKPSTIPPSSIATSPQRRKLSWRTVLPSSSTPPTSNMSLSSHVHSSSRQTLTISRSVVNLTDDESAIAAEALDEVPPTVRVSTGMNIFRRRSSGSGGWGRVGGGSASSGSSRGSGSHTSPKSTFHQPLPSTNIDTSAARYVGSTTSSETSSSLNKSRPRTSLVHEIQMQASSTCQSLSVHQVLILTPFGEPLPSAASSPPRPWSRSSSRSIPPRAQPFSFRSSVPADSTSRVKMSSGSSSRPDCTSEPAHLRSSSPVSSAASHRGSNTSASIALAVTVTVPMTRSKSMPILTSREVEAVREKDEELGLVRGSQGFAWVQDISSGGSPEMVNEDLCLASPAFTIENLITPPAVEDPSLRPLLLRAGDSAVAFLDPFGSGSSSSQQHPPILTPQSSSSPYWYDTGYASTHYHGYRRASTFDRTGATDGPEVIIPVPPIPVPILMPLPAASLVPSPKRPSLLRYRTLPTGPISDTVTPDLSPRQCFQELQLNASAESPNGTSSTRVPDTRSSQSSPERSSRKRGTVEIAWSRINPFSDSQMQSQAQPRTKSPHGDRRSSINRRGDGSESFSSNSAFFNPLNHRRGSSESSTSRTSSHAMDSVDSRTSRPSSVRMKRSVSKFAGMLSGGGIRKSSSGGNRASSSTMASFSSQQQSSPPSQPGSWVRRGSWARISILDSNSVLESSVQPRVVGGSMDMAAVAVAGSESASAPSASASASASPASASGSTPTPTSTSTPFFSIGRRRSSLAPPTSLPAHQPTKYVVPVVPASASASASSSATTPASSSSSVGGFHTVSVDLDRMGTVKLDAAASWQRERLNSLDVGKGPSYAGGPSLFLPCSIPSSSSSSPRQGFVFGTLNTPSSSSSSAFPATATTSHNQASQGYVHHRPAPAPPGSAPTPAPAPILSPPNNSLGWAWLRRGSADIILNSENAQQPRRPSSSASAGSSSPPPFRASSTIFGFRKVSITESVESRGSGGGGGVVGAGAGVGVGVGSSGNRGGQTPFASWHERRASWAEF